MTNAMMNEHATARALYPERLPTAKTPQQRAYFTRGYCKFEALAPQGLIDDLLETFERVVIPHAGPILRHNGLKQSHELINGRMVMPMVHLHDPQQTAGLEAFAEASLALFTCDALRDAMRSLTGEMMRLEQSLFYDLCPDPVSSPHHDGIYVDSVPFGHLVAAWIALEDIHPEAGRLFFLPWDATPPLPQFSRADVFDTDVYKKTMRDIVAPLPDKIDAPAMKKGDVLMWNSRIIHGGMPATNRAVTRRSLAGHFIPHRMQAGNIFGDAYFSGGFERNGVFVRSAHVRARDEKSGPAIR